MEGGDGERVTRRRMKEGARRAAVKQEREKKLRFKKKHQDGIERQRLREHKTIKHKIYEETDEGWSG